MEDRRLSKKDKKRENIKRETNKKVSTILDWKWIIFWLSIIIEGCGCCGWYGSYLSWAALDWTWLGRHWVGVTVSTSLYGGLDWSRFDRLDPILPIVLELYWSVSVFIILLTLWFSIENEGINLIPFCFFFSSFLVLFTCLSSFLTPDLPPFILFLRK